MSLRLAAHEALHALAGTPALPIGAAIAAYALGALAIGARLAAAARAFGASLSMVRGAAIGLSTVFASHVSFGAAAGEVARLGWMARLTRGRPDAARATLGILLADRIAHGVSLAILLAIATAAGLRGDHARLLVLGMVAIATLGALALRRGGATGRAIRGAWAALPAALTAWVLDLVRLHLVAGAVGLSIGLTPLCALALAALVGAQTPTPGGIGGVEAAMIAAGAALGLPPSPLAAAVLVDRALSLGLGTALGALCTTGLVPSHPRGTS